MERNKIKILAIDDNKDNLISLKALIREAFPDSITLMAENGSTGIELVKTEVPDVILLDVVMPGMDGFEVCEILKSNPVTHDIPVVFLTALKGDKESRIRALAVGAEAFLAKPIDETELTAQVNAMLKIKTASDHQRNEKEQLARLVAEQTQELEQTHIAALNLLDDLHEENEARKKSEAALRESQELLLRSEADLNKAQRVAKVGSWTWYIQEDRLEWSDEMYRLFGYQRETFDGKLAEVMEQAIHPEDRPMVEKANRSVIENGKPVPLEYRVVWPDGTVRVVWAEAGELILGDHGEPIILSGIVQDITERNQAEDALRESEERFRQLFQSMESGFALHEIICDAQGTPCDYRFLEINPAFEKLTGLSAESLLGHTTMEVMPGTEKIWIERYGKVALTGVPNHFENFAQELGKYFRVTAYSPRYGLFATIFEDVTEIKRAEEEKQLLVEQLLQAQKMESVGRLAGGVAHDFNNLLGVIIGRAESALAKVSPHQPVYQDLHEILKAGGRSADLTRQLLTFARKQPVSPIVLDLNKAISSIFEMLRRLIGESIQLDWMPGSDLWYVRVDSSQLDQILTNLVVNARDAIPGEGKVVVKTGNFVCEEAFAAKNPGMDPGEYVLLSVSDNGNGMDAETRSHLFEPFFTTKEMGKGTGLGLSTVFGIVKQNNGVIQVSSELGRGTTFSIYIPRVEAELSPIVASEPARIIQSVSETILMVDDEGALLDMGKEALEDLGYTVLAVATPDEALRKAQEHDGEIHLLITDVMMPGMNGQVLAEQLRTHLPHLKCLFMSGYSDDILTVRGVVPEQVSFIQKPFSLGTLAGKVREVLRQK